MPPVLAAAIWDAMAVGQLFGGCLASLISLTAIVVSASLMQRPRTNRVGGAALLLALVGWLVGGAGGVAALIAPAAWSQVVAVACGVVIAICFLAAIVVAIVALAIHDSTKHDRGRGQAVAGLVVGLLLLVAGVTVGVMEVMREPGADAPSAMVRADAAKEVRAEEFNFAITPPAGWIATKPRMLNELACLAFRHLRPEGYVIVIGEHPETTLSQSDYMDIVVENLATAVESVSDDRRGEMEVGGVRFDRRSCVATGPEANGVPLFFDQYVATRPGFAWQFMFWCRAADKERFRREFERTMQSFRLLDERRSVAPGAGVANLDRPAVGYRTALDASQWRPWKAGAVPLADFAALRPTERVLVMPVTLPFDDVLLDDVARALVGCVGVRYPGDGWTTSPWASGWGDGLELTGTGEVDGMTCTTILRVARRGRLAHLHAGWAERSSGDLDAVRRALDAVELIAADRPETAAVADPVGDPRRVTLSRIVNDVGIESYRRSEFARAAACFREAVDLDPADPAGLGNLIDALRADGRTAEALAVLAPAMERFVGSPDLQVRLAHLRADAGDHEAAHAAFLTAVGAGLADEDQTLTWLQALSARGRHEDMVIAAEAWMKKSPGVNSRRWHAQAVAAAGDPQRAVDLLEALAKGFPGDDRVTGDLAEALNEAGEYARAADVAERLLARSPESLRPLLVLGWSQMGRKWYREAKATFERAARREPHAEGVQEALRLASAMLGQGRNSGMATPLEPVEMPAAVRRLTDDHRPPEAYGDGQGAVCLRSVVGYHFDRGKPLRRTVSRRVRILTTRGANDLSSIEQAFDPLTERICIDRVSVRGEHGAETLAADVADDAYVMDLEDGQASHRARLHVQVPGLRPGCVLDYAITTEGLSSSDEFPFERHLFADSAVDVVFLTGDAIDEVAVVAPPDANAVREVVEGGLRAWVAFDTVIDHPEPLSAPAEDRLPGLCLGSRHAWEEVAADYLADIQDRFGATAEVTALAQELTAGVEDDTEKVARLAGHVQRGISYSALAFGVRARRPKPAAETLADKYGDCKDQALLLHTLLAAANVESHLVLVSTSAAIQPALPSLDQFDHMVVHVPCLGEGRLVDTTNSHLQLERWQADGLWRSHALILDGDRTRLADPVEHPERGSCLVESRRTISRAGEDGWRVREALTMHGYYASWMRGAFTGLDGPQVLLRAQSLMERHGRLQLESARFDALDDTSKPVTLELEYVVPNAIRADGGGLRSTVPAAWEHDYVAMPFVRDRRTPFVFRYPFEFRSHVTFEGMEPSFGPALRSLGTKDEGGHASHELRVDVTVPERPVLDFTFTAGPGSYPAGAYAAWHEEWTRAIQAWEKPVAWTP